MPVTENKKIVMFLLQLLFAVSNQPLIFFSMKISSFLPVDCRLFLLKIICEPYADVRRKDTK